MASNKSDVRRPLCCAADDDAFPLPDYLAPINDRPLVNVREFVNIAIPIPPSISPQSSTNEQLQQQPQLLNRREHLPRTAIVSTLQPPPRVFAPNPVSAPSLSALLQQIPPETPSAASQTSTIINIAIYNSQSPTKTAELSFPSTTPLFTLINVLPCTARPNLINTPSSALLYIGNTIYNYALPRRTNYATPIQKFLRNNASSKPPNRQSITPSSPNLEDISFVLGRPYTILHHADCEHLIIFTDIFHSHQQNPIPTIHHRPPRLTPCDVCRRRAADRFTVADPLADASPFHYCAHCFRDAHYSHQGPVFDRTAGFRAYSHHSPL